MTRYDSYDSYDDDEPLGTARPDPLESTQPVSSTPPRPPSSARPTRSDDPQHSDRTPTFRQDRPALPRDSRQARQAAPLRPPTGSIDYSPADAPSRRRRPPAAPARPARSKRDSGLYLPWWSLVIMLFFVGGAAIGAWAVVDTMGGDVLPGGSTPIVIVVTATFTVGPPPTFTPLPQVAVPTPPPLPTIAVTATLPPGDFRIGATVQVVGVGITGLNVRSGPGINSPVRFIAPENARFILKNGPQQASSQEWWELQDPNDPLRGGWASRSYLTVIAGQ